MLGRLPGALCRCPPPLTRVIELAGCCQQRASIHASTWDPSSLQCVSSRRGHPKHAAASGAPCVPLNGPAAAVMAARVCTDPVSSCKLTAHDAVGRQGQARHPCWRAMGASGAKVTNTPVRRPEQRQHACSVPSRRHVLRYLLFPKPGPISGLGTAGSRGYLAQLARALDTALCRNRAVPSRIPSSRGPPRFAQVSASRTA